MIIEFDIEKNVGNIAKHGVPFTVALGMDFANATVIQDMRFAYGEDRFVAFGYVGRRLYVLVFTWRGMVMRIISLRKSNARERIAYG
jgi:hypothetical protein